MPAPSPAVPSSALPACRADRTPSLLTACPPARPLWYCREKLAERQQRQIRRYSAPRAPRGLSAGASTALGAVAGQQQRPCSALLCCSHSRCCWYCSPTSCRWYCSPAACCWYCSPAACSVDPDRRPLPCPAAYLEEEGEEEEEALYGDEVGGRRGEAAARRQPRSAQEEVSGRGAAPPRAVPPGPQRARRRRTAAAQLAWLPYRAPSALGLRFLFLCTGGGRAAAGGGHGGRATLCRQAAAGNRKRGRGGDQRGRRGRDAGAPETRPGERTAHG